MRSRDGVTEERDFDREGRGHYESCARHDAGDAVKKFAQIGGTTAGTKRGGNGKYFRLVRRAVLPGKICGGSRIETRKPHQKIKAVPGKTVNDWRRRSSSRKELSTEFCGKRA